MIAYRTAEPRDRRYIVARWESSLQHANTAGPIPMEMWADVMRPIVAYYLDREYTRTIVACNPDDPDPIADLQGFIVGEPDERIIYYVYVDEPYRRAGIARRLFAALGVDPAKPFTYLCSTPVVPRLARQIPMAAWKPNPARYSREFRRPR